MESDPVIGYVYIPFCFAFVLKSDRLLVMENAALNAIRPFLDVGETAVGTAIDVRHLAATPVGHDVRAEAEVIKVEGKRIEFKVSASDEMEEIGKGTHQRTVINLRSFNERLAEKAQR